GITDGLVAIDNAWRFTYVNAAAERMWNRKASDLIGRTIFDTLRIDPNNPFQVNYAASKKTGEPVAFTAYSELIKGWLEVRGYPHPLGYTIFFRDVTKERLSHRATLEIERKLEAAEALTRRIFDTSLDLILVASSYGDLIEVNPSSEAILGYRPD